MLSKLCEGKGKLADIKLNDGPSGAVSPIRENKYRMMLCQLNWDVFSLLVRKLLIVIMKTNQLY